MCGQRPARHDYIPGLVATMPLDRGTAIARRQCQMRSQLISTLAVGVLLWGCVPGSPLREAVRPSSPYERYAESLRDAGLDETALGRDWLTAGGGVLANATPVDLPLQETGYLPPDEPAARAWRFSLAQGRRLVIDVETVAAEPFRVYLDLFELRGEPPQLQLVASAPDGAEQLEFEPERDGTFVLRLQPELLRGGRFTITEQTTATLTFPIEGRDGRTLASSFGDPRDAGGREHQGIDIFAPRGSPVLAAAEGWVTSAGTNNLGGNVVWIRTSRRQTHYYAHLETQLVRAGTHVRAGEPIGTVGNTGNARTTAPHLHFGIYRPGSGAIDPFPFVFTGTARPAPVTAATDALGSWRRTSRTNVPLRGAPALTAPIVRDLPRHTIVHIDGAVRDWYRVQLPDGTTGFVSGRLTESTVPPIRTARTDAVQLLDRPTVNAAPMADLEARLRLPVLGHFGDFLFVRTPDGREGWIRSYTS
jgi:murein DD-endopeptidase MepM/ murein hydrolase activator NlpD